MKRLTHTRRVRLFRGPVSLEAMGTGCCATVDIKKMLAVSGHVLVSHDTSPVQSPRCYTKLCKCPLLRCNCNWSPRTWYSSSRKRAVVHEPTVTSGKLLAAMNQSPSRKSCSKTTNKSFFTCVAAPFIVQSLASTEVRRRTHEFSHASGHSIHCWAHIVGLIPSVQGHQPTD